MQRSVMDSLVEWKNRKNRMPLVLEGVRQCGKTYIMKKFGEEHFPDYAYFNFEENPFIAPIFEGTLNPSRILSELSLIRKKKIGEECLIIFDEIQTAGRAITSLKYFTENMPEAYVIAAGSLLGVSASSPGSFPVGKVDTIRMYPMSFREFISAMGEEEIAIHITDDGEVSKHANDVIKNLLDQFFIVGGMPAAVQSWSAKKDIAEVDRILDNIATLYKKDFTKYAGSNKTGLYQVWDSIPSQLMKDNSKFMFGHVKSGGRARELEESAMWLINAGLVHMVNRTEKPDVPLSMNADPSVYKLYLSDIGLLRRMMGAESDIMHIEDERTALFRGALAENYVLCELMYSGIKPFYWRSGGTAEVDFLIQHKMQIIPVKVKYGRSTRIASLKVYIERYSPDRAILVSSDENPREGVESVPLHLLWNTLRGLCRRRQGSAPQSFDPGVDISRIAQIGLEAVFFKHRVCESGCEQGIVLHTVRCDFHVGVFEFHPPLHAVILLYGIQGLGAPVVSRFDFDGNNLASHGDDEIYRQVLF